MKHGACWSESSKDMRSLLCPALQLTLLCTHEAKHVWSECTYSELTFPLKRYVLRLIIEGVTFLITSTRRPELPYEVYIGDIIH